MYKKLLLLVFLFSIATLGYMWAGTAYDQMQLLSPTPREMSIETTASVEKEQNIKPNVDSSELKTVLVAGGCFWCVESDFEKLFGVIQAVSGYAGGSSEDPSYSDYYKSGHREVVEVVYNPDKLSFRDLIIYNLKHTDPTDDKGSFGDRGDHYSTALYYSTEEEKAIIENVIKSINENGPFDRPLAVDVEERPRFFPAEEFHQDYYKGAFSGLKYKAYRTASGRDTFIKKHWENDTGTTLSWEAITVNNTNTTMTTSNNDWKNFTKPNKTELQKMLTPLQYKVTQEDGTEPPFNNQYDDNKEAGIYVDIVSGEPLFASVHKFDSGTGWPSFTQPIKDEFVTEHEDGKLFFKRTEVRSAIADSHLGHVFSDGPQDRGGKRYCMNSAALKFVPEAQMTEQGYGEFLYLFQD